MKKVDKTPAEIIREYKDDFELCARDMLKVRDHNTSEILPLIFRPGQQVMHDVAKKREKEKGFLRFLLLKNRRFGGSTYIAGRGYHKAIFNFNINSFIIAHETDSTNTLFKMVQLFQEKNPIKPVTKTSNAQELIFDNKTGTGLKSEYKLATAKNVEAGRSQGIHFLHASEEAMWPGHAALLLTSLFQTIPRPPAKTEVWRESTGKGYGNSFQIDCFKAYAEGKYPYFTAPLKQYAPHMQHSKAMFHFAYHDPDSDWVLIFIPWMLDPSCQKEFENEEKREQFKVRINLAQTKKDDINFGALRIQEQYGLTLEQLYWREWSIRNECLESVPTFNQENPLTVIDAFITKGKGHYPAEFCNMVEKSCRLPAITGDIMYRMGFPVVEPKSNGSMQVWEQYDPTQEYFMTVDTAGGKRDIISKGDKEPDKTVIDVWNRNNGKQVAQWHGHQDYDLISDIVIAIGTMYGKATACVELNNHGYKVVGDLRDVQYPQYYWKPGEPGWSTNKRTKPIMADDLLMGCRDGVITIRCKETVAEMRTYIEISGRFGAEAGTHDDRVTTAQLAVQMMSKLPRKIGLQDNYYEDKYSRGGAQAWMTH